MPEKYQKKSSLLQKIVFIISLFAILVGVYILAILLAPKIYQQYQIHKLESQQELDEGNRVVIAKLGINVSIIEGGVEALEQGAWHQYPELGNPEQGGNFILAAHSFFWGMTPLDAVRKSYFYNLSEANVGDEILVRWSDQVYSYKVTEIKQITPNDTTILAPSNEPIMTLYTCTPGGSADGRVVVIAKPQ